MAATRIQLLVYQWHRQVCNDLGIVQSTLKHKSLQGTASAPSSSGNVIYTGPAPSTNLTVTTDTKVWVVWEPLRQRGDRGDDSEAGRTSVPYMRGQIPAIDDNQNPITVQQDDWISDSLGKLYRIDNPTISPDGAIWSFSLEFQR